MEDREGQSFWRIEESNNQDMREGIAEHDHGYRMEVVVEWAGR